MGSEADRSASEGRWSDAQSVVDGVATEGARRRLHRQKVIRLSIVVAVTVVPLIGLALVLVLTDHRSGGPQETSATPLWREVVSFSLFAVGLVLEVIGVVRTVRARRWGAAWRSATAVLSGPERKQLLKQVRGQQVPDPARLPLARDLAHNLVAQRHFLLMSLGVMLMTIARPILSGSSGNRGLSLTLAGLTVTLLAVGAPLMMRDVRRAQAFLEQHPLPEPADPLHSG